MIFLKQKVQKKLQKVPENLRQQKWLNSAQKCKNVTKKERFDTVGAIIPTCRMQDFF